MNKITFLSLALLLTAVSAHSSRAESTPRAVLPDAVVDLRTTDGATRVNAQWRYHDTVISQIEHRDVGADLKASGKANHTFDFSPDARATDFDDSKWEVIPPDSLEDRKRTRLNSSHG